MQICKNNLESRINYIVHEMHIGSARDAHITIFINYTDIFLISLSFIFLPLD